MKRTTMTRCNDLAEAVYDFLKEYYFLVDNSEDWFFDFTEERDSGYYTPYDVVRMSRNFDDIVLFKVHLKHLIRTDPDARKKHRLTNGLEFSLVEVANLL